MIEIMTRDPSKGRSGDVTWQQDTTITWITGGTLLFMPVPLGFVAHLLLSIPVLFGTVMGLLVIGMAAVCALLGLRLCRAARRRSIGLTVTATGIAVTTLFGTYQADWSSLGPFVAGMRRRPRGPAMKCARARIIGPGISKNLRGRSEVVVLDWHTTPIETITDELNAWRLKYCKTVTSTASSVRTEFRQSGIDLPQRRTSWVLPITIIGLIDLGILYELYVLL